MLLFFVSMPCRICSMARSMEVLMGKENGNFSFVKFLGFSLLITVLLTTK